MGLVNVKVLAKYFFFLSAQKIIIGTSILSKVLLNGYVWGYLIITLDKILKKKKPYF